MIIKDYQNIFHLIRNNCFLNKDLELFINGDDKITYGEVFECILKLNYFFENSLNLKKGDNIALVVERSYEQLLYLYTSFCYGLNVIIINDDLPVDRINSSLIESKPKVIFCNDAKKNVYEDLKLNAFNIEDFDFNKAEKKAEYFPELLFDDNAYILFTSGSSGKPKGVQISHGNISNYINWASKFYFNEKSIVSYFTPLGFDLTFTSVLCPILTKGKIEIINNKFNNITSLEYIFGDDSACNIIKLTPTHITCLSSFIFRNPRITTVIVGGEQLLPKHIEILEDYNDNVIVYNEYGPTEATIGCTVKKIVPKEKYCITVGLPISNNLIFIIDDNGLEIEKGETGELIICGDQIAKGYLDTELSNEKFKEVFINDKICRAYFTGDMGYVSTENNEIICVGRKDDQIKLNGYRVELDEINAVLSSSDLVGSSKVLFKDNKIEAYILPNRLNCMPILKKEDQQQKILSFEEGFNLNYLNKSEAEMVYNEIFEDNCYMKNGISFKDGDVLIDVGANIGVCSLYFGLGYKNAKIYSLEPVLPVFEVLTKNIDYYNLTNVERFNFGLSDKNEICEFDFYSNNSVLSGRYGSVQEEHLSVNKYLLNTQEGVDEFDIKEVISERVVSTKIKCKVVTLSDFISDHKIDEIDLLKIDVEKSEIDVINGILEDDWAKIKQIIIEVHDIDGRLKSVCSLLESKGYSVTYEQDLIVKGTLIYNIYGIRDVKADTLFTKAPCFKFNTDGGVYTSYKSYVEDIETYISKILPSYMIPKSLTVLSHFPMNSNGKLEEKSLNDFIINNKTNNSDSKDIIDLRLYDIWKNVLGHENFKSDDSFFNIGGDSLNILLLRSKINAKFNSKISIKEIFNNESIMAQDKLIKDLK